VTRREIRGIDGGKMRQFWLQQREDDRVWCVMSREDAENGWALWRAATGFEIGIWRELTEGVEPCPACSCTGGWLFPKQLSYNGIRVCRCCGELCSWPAFAIKVFLDGINTRQVW
jgi:hypothetical protein